MEYVKRNNIDDSTIFTGKSAHEKVREQWLSAEKNWKLISSEISFTNKDRENLFYKKRIKENRTLMADHLKEMAAMGRKSVRK